MSDISLPIPALPTLSLWKIAHTAAILALALVAASIKIEQCEIVPGAFSNGFSSAFNVSRKACGQAALIAVLAHKAVALVRHIIIASG